MAVRNHIEAILLHSEHPFFQIPILSFIEQHCIVFNHDEAECEEYRIIHKEYQKIVCELLNCFRDDAGLSEDQLTSAMNEINKSYNEDVSCFNGYCNGRQHILALNDYAHFLHQMQNANIEMNEQAMHLLQQYFKGGQMANSVSPDEASRLAQVEEDAEFARAIQESKDLYNREHLENKTRFEGPPQVNPDFLSNSSDTVQLPANYVGEPEPDFGAKDTPPTAVVVSGIPHLPTVDVGPGFTPKKSNAPGGCPPVLAGDVGPDFTPKKSNAPGGCPPVLFDPTVPLAAGGAVSSQSKKGKSSRHKAMEMTSSAAATSWLENAKEECSVAPTDQRSASVANLTFEERQHFLKKQRDILIKKRKEEREKELFDAETNCEVKRPASANKARSTMLQQSKDQGKEPMIVEESTEDKKKLATRKTIAERIKKEVSEK